MIRPVLRCLLLVLCAAGRASGADSTPAGLLWPTDAGSCVTSNFCEFRPGHFHSGIDISTGGKTGFRCFAVGDGDIVRARVSCGGYGRAIYLRLSDGRTVVYAHLARFEASLADTIRARQEAAGSSYLDATFAAGVFPVRRGEIIGWTGQSGAGVPHLHVEIRDDLERPMDPLAEGLGVADVVPPEVVRIALSPLTARSSVDGDSDTQILDVHPGEAGASGAIPRVIPVEGEIGISVEVDETTDVCRFRLAPRRLELREGDRLLYAVEYDRFDFSETGLMDLQIDPRYSYRKRGRFHHLWRRAGNTLPFGSAGSERSGRIGGNGFESEDAADAAQASSVEPPGERRRSFEIVVYDASGNRGRAEVQLSFAAPPEVSVLSARLDREAAAALGAEASLEETWADTVEVHGALRASGRAMRAVELEHSHDAGGTWVRAGTADIGIDHSFHGRFAVPARIPGAGSEPVLVRARALDALGAGGLAKTVALEGSPAPPPVEPPFEVVTRGGWFEVRFPETVAWSGLAGGAGGGDSLFVRSWGRGVRLVCRRANWASETVEWSGHGEPWAGFDPWGRPVPLRLTAPPLAAAGSDPTSPDGRARFRFRADTLPERAYVLVREEPAPSDAPELRALSPLYVLDTGQVPLRRNYDVSIEPQGPADEGHLGIFVQEPGGLRYIDTARSEGRWTAGSGTVLGLGLFEDVTEPVLGEPRLEESHGRVRLTFRADDQGAGIRCDDVQVLCEDAPILYELDDETGDVVAYPPVPAVSGASARFDIRVTDRCGNSVRRVETVSFP